MHITTRLLGKLTLSLGVIATLGVLNSNVAWSQNTPSKASDGYQSSEQDSIFGGDSFNPLDLIHNANLGGSISGEEFRNESNQNLDNAANEFRRLQLERFKQQQQESQENEPQ